MTSGEVPSGHDPPHDAPAAKVERKRGISLVWIVPIVAAAIGAWLWWDALQQKGPEVTIEFHTAEGLEAGKTKLLFKSVEVGSIESVELKPDLSGVIATAKMRPKTEPLLHQATRFWVVRPRIGLAGVSGLSTLLSGAYLEIDPAREGAESRSFVGLEEPPQTPSDAPGLKLALDADALGSVGVGSPVSHRGLTVGKVEGYHLLNDSDELRIDIYIDPGYAQHVRADSRFWNTSGIDLSFGAEGLKFTASSLVTLLSGGVEFDTVGNESESPPAKTGGVYRLYPDRTASREVFTETRQFVLYFAGSVRGLAPGAPVEFRGIRLGTVTSFSLESKPFETALTRVLVEIEPQRIGRGFEAGNPQERTAALIASGLRARLATGSLLTGALFVELVIDRDSVVVRHGPEGELEVPTLPSTSEELAQTLDEIPAIMADVRRAVAGLADLATSADAQQALGDVRGVSAAAKEVLAQAQALLADQSNLQLRLASALEELAAGFRSIRQLTDTLDRQPEALIKGKSTDPGER
jgi:paraquat-inducible protein B